MKERPIIFNAQMVRALLAGTKMQTRRIAKPVKHPDLGNVYAPGALVLEREPQHVIERACPYGQPGDWLWVREGHALDGRRVFYRAGHGEEEGSGPRVDVRWRPSIHMPRWASRINLEITGIRVERLQDISEADAITEGCMQNANGYYRGGPHKVSGSKQMATAVKAYRDLWESINGAGSWELNPWVWVVEFKRLEGGAA